MAESRFLDAEQDLMNSDAPNPAPLVLDASRISLGGHSNGPLEWDQGALGSDWRNFHPKLLCSVEGIHMILSPCDPSWWTKRQIEGIPSSGLQFKTAFSEFVLETRPQNRAAPRSKDKAAAWTTVILSKPTGDVMAQFKERTSVTFLDGVRFKCAHRKGALGLGPDKYEFSDETGRSQFRLDRKGRIWLTDRTDRTHVLFLIAADRYFRELDRVKSRI